MGYFSDIDIQIQDMSAAGKSVAQIAAATKLPVSMIQTYLNEREDADDKYDIESNTEE